MTAHAPLEDDWLECPLCDDAFLDLEVAATHLDLHRHDPPPAPPAELDS